MGVPPEIMGIGPVPAIQNVLKSAGLTLNDIDLVEVSIMSLYQSYFHLISLLNINRLTKHSVPKHWLALKPLT